MKKITACLMAVLLLATLLTACTSVSGNTGEAGGDSRKLRIVTTIFPPYDWVRQVLGGQADTAELTLLLGSGVDMHSYQPTADDIIAISSCDLFIYTGGESDRWVEDALLAATNSSMVVINLLDVLGDAVKEEELVEGMQQAHDHTDGHDHDDGDDHSHGEAELDEHVWLSLRHAQTLCSHIAGALAGLDPDNAEAYTANATAYNGQLAALDEGYQEAARNATVTTLLFADRFPFRYLVDDYGLQYYAAFSGCSAETEATFDTIVFLAHKVEELALQHVMVIETSDGSIARTVIQSTEGKAQQILVLDSLQSVTSSGASSGASYLSIMESNLEILKQALS